MNWNVINSKTIQDEDPVRQALMIGFFNDLNEFMTSRHKYKRPTCRPFINKVDARCSKFALTLNYRHDDSAGISAIRFKDKRRGHCTALVEFIDRVSVAYCIPNIEFISVMSDEMRAFLRKHGFINREPRYCPIEEAYIDSKDWYRPTPFGISQGGNALQQLEIPPKTG